MKIVKSLLITCVVLFLGYVYYQSAYVGEDYYVKIEKLVPKTLMIDDDGKSMDEEACEYDVTAYSEKGEAREIEFTWRSETPIPKGSWLKITASARGSLGEEIVKKNEVPKLVQDKY